MSDTEPPPDDYCDASWLEEIPPVPAVTYASCPHHPHVMLPIASRRGEEHICYECGQEHRRNEYARQRDETMPTYEARNATKRIVENGGAG